MVIYWIEGYPWMRWPMHWPAAGTLGYLMCQLWMVYDHRLQCWMGQAWLMMYVICLTVQGFHMDLGMGRKHHNFAVNVLSRWLIDMLVQFTCIEFCFYFLLRGILLSKSTCYGWAHSFPPPHHLSHRCSWLKGFYAPFNHALSFTNFSRAIHQRTNWLKLSRPDFYLANSNFLRIFTEVSVGYRVMKSIISGKLVWNPQNKKESEMTWFSVQDIEFD